MSKTEFEGPPDQLPEPEKGKETLIPTGLIILAMARRLFVFQSLRNDYVEKQEGISEEEMLISLSNNWLAYDKNTTSMVFHHLVRLREEGAALYSDGKWFYNDEFESNRENLDVIFGGGEFDYEDQAEVDIDKKEVERSKEASKKAEILEDDVPYLRSTSWLRSYDPNSPKMNMYDGSDEEGFWDDDGMHEPG